MEAKTTELLEKAASFVEEAGKKIAALEGGKTEFQKRASEASASLVRRGLLQADKASEWAAKVAASPELVFGVVEKLAAAAAVAELGAPAGDVKTADDQSEGLDAFDRFYLTGSSRRGVGGSSEIV